MLESNSHLESKLLFKIGINSEELNNFNPLKFIKTCATKEITTLRN